METGIWRKSGRRTIHLGRFCDQKTGEEDPVFKYYPAENGGNNGGTRSSSKMPKWKVIWKNLLKQRKKGFEPAMQGKAAYNSETYMQNFDEGQSGQTIDEYLNDFLPRSFTARYADPSKLLS
ncbi:OLC1v1037280C1 [Oldenlandia corymbosa var. corymbosa]|uniref:OLC1v1037280C1 n=1 Tax=Oldenlandia corymbosa var. corymbosa TaxID=529605 RepID=A0AAV1D0I8_OLDCO|nr:OLC1v1037280C1 [Oldenlandia corymbosa var. corymbosa]